MDFLRIWDFLSIRGKEIGAQETTWGITWVYRRGTFTVRKEGCGALGYANLQLSGGVLNTFPLGDSYNRRKFPFNPHLFIWAILAGDWGLKIPFKPFLEVLEGVFSTKVIWFLKERA